MTITIEELAENLKQIIFSESLTESEKYDLVDAAVCSATNLRGKERLQAYCKGCGWTEELRKIMEERPLDEHGMPIPLTPEEQQMYDDYCHTYEAYYPRPHRVWYSYRGDE